MKKTIFMALVMLASASLSTNAADKKKKNKDKAEAVHTVEIPVQLVSISDSISYAAGLASTQGLITYLQRSLDLDTMYMADFKKGFYDAIERGTDPKYVAYNAGVQIASQVRKQILPQQQAAFEGTADSIKSDLFYRGFIDGAMGDTNIMDAHAAADFAREKQNIAKEKQNAVYIAENTKWLEENKAKDGVVTTPSGLQYKIITKGDGAVAETSDNVTVKYEGKMIDGTVFDSSYKRNPDTTSFRPDQVIKGWTEALCMMPEGSKWELYIPQELAYGERQAGNIKPYSTLIFTVEVIKVEKKDSPAVETKPAALIVPAKTMKPVKAGKQAKSAASKAVVKQTKK